MKESSGTDPRDIQNDPPSPVRPASRSPGWDHESRRRRPRPPPSPLKYGYGNRASVRPAPENRRRLRTPARCPRYRRSFPQRPPAFPGGQRPRNSPWNNKFPGCFSSAFPAPYSDSHYFQGNSLLSSLSFSRFCDFCPPSKFPIPNAVWPKGRRLPLPQVQSLPPQMFSYSVPYDNRLSK